MIYSQIRLKSLETISHHQGHLEGHDTQQRSQPTPPSDYRLITKAFEESEIDYKLPTIIFPMSTIVAFIKALLTIYNTGVVPLPTVFDWKHQRSLIF